MSYGAVFEIINPAFTWDGWRALAAIGTMAAVWVALSRDTASEKRQAIRDSHVIGAMISELNYVISEVDDFEKARINRKNLSIFFSKLDRSNHLPGSELFFRNIKLSDCPTVEVMTTVSVTDRLMKSVISTVDLGRESIKGSADHFTPPPHLDLESMALKMCRKDLKDEQRWVAGRYYKIATQDGHRKQVEKRSSLSPRRESLKSIPLLIKTIVTNRPQNTNSSIRSPRTKNDY